MFNPEYYYAMYIWSKKKPGFFQTKHGELWLDPSTGWNTYLRSKDRWEPKVKKKIYETVRPGDHVIDLGTNYGEYAIQFAELVGEKGSVTCVESDPKFIKIFEETRKRNVNGNRIRIIESFIDEKYDYRLFEKATYVFSDIEGYEQSVIDKLFSDPEKYLVNNPRFLIEFHPHVYGKEKEEELKDTMRRQGYVHEKVDVNHSYFYRKEKNV